MSETQTTRIMLATTVVLLALSAFRWHQAAAAAPDRIREADGAVAVLVVQPGDCPLRRAAMMAWLTAFRGRSRAPARPPVALAVLRDGPGAVDDRLTSLPRLGAADTRTAARAILRAGAPGTPAVVLLGPDGDVLLADTFEPDGLGPRILRGAHILSLVADSAALPPSSLPGEK